ncbi:conserved hypothetical protein [Nitrosococcus oceani ATCC 19707]|uniref:DUF4342 domain-containing protein n=2 Tax=Nitrosococcus oceani TaxID=1229 RepID=Q3JBF2_NITOC|nr:DUF4342 domain-containing protein [Nitrosococcus oceani]ABA57844.1 conserved hypothetical protein [Nitrosococcus oceani ATCC 19707]EDZ67714.1 hypothetical protein NOC27_1041 [Nitrosococcus oceani AFC27]KFI19724.1 hypothetical protein IB75_07040 [Nitrosococcus oceani C-27]GEM19481.1 hypothetical protein NONS58_08680 [Nitrosococcus oceani]
MGEQSGKNINRPQIDKTQEKYEEVLNFINKWLKKGNLHRLVIRKPSGHVFMEIPLTVGVAIGGILLFFTPMLLALSALVALFKQIKIEIVRTDDGG